MTHREYPLLRKVFLQWMFVERLVLFSRAQEFFLEITSTLDFGLDEDNEKDINAFIDFCKKALNPVSLSLKKQLFVQTDKKFEYIGICNIKSDCISQMATKFNAENIDQFKKIIELSRNSPNHELTLHQFEQVSKLSKNQVQTLINDFIEGDWISFDKSKGVFFLGPRTLLELGDYLKERTDGSNDDNNSNEFQDCSLCSSIISCGSKIICNNNECKLQYHSFCFNEYSKTTAKSECPKCRGSINNLL